MKRQYQVFYKRFGSPKFVQLERGTHSGLYSRPEVQSAVEYLRMHPHVKGMAFESNGNEMFNVLAIADQEAEAPRSFYFEASQDNFSFEASLMLTEENILIAGDKNLPLERIVVRSLFNHPAFELYEAETAIIKATSQPIPADHFHKKIGKYRITFEQLPGEAMYADDMKATAEAMLAEADALEVVAEGEEVPKTNA